MNLAYSLVVAFFVELDRQKLYQSLTVAFKCYPNGFGSYLIHKLRDYMIENLEEYHGNKHPNARAESLRKKGYRIYEMTLDDEDCDWIVGLLYQNNIDFKTSRMQLWKYSLGDER